MANQLEVHASTTHCGTVDASAAPCFNVFVAPCTVKIVAMYLVANTTKALHSANYGTYTISNKGQTGSGTTSVGSQTTHTGGTGANALAPDKAEVFTLSTTAASLKLVAGDVLQFSAAESGTATSGDLTECAIGIHYIPVAA